MKNILVVFLCLITAIFTGSSLYMQANHITTDPARVVASNLYITNQGIGSSAHIQGTITLHDFRNNFNYTYRPGCTYYTVGMNVTVYIQWVSGFSTEYKGYIINIVDQPSGCYSL